MRQLQAEVKKLKELLAQAVTSPGGDYRRDVAPGGPGLPIGNTTSTKHMLTITPSNNIVFKQLANI